MSRIINADIQSGWIENPAKPESSQTVFPFILLFSRAERTKKAEDGTNTLKKVWR